MQVRKYAIIVAIAGLSVPVFAASTNLGGAVTGGASVGASGTNETAGASSAGVSGQGSGSADLNTVRPSLPNRADQQRRTDRARDRSSNAGSSMDATTDGAAGATGSTGGAGVGVGTGIGVGVGAGGLGVGVGADANVGASATGTRR